MLYAIYTDISLSAGLDQIKDYLGASPDMYSNQTKIDFEFAPQKFLLNLETMEAIEAEASTSGGFSTFSIDDAIAACEAL